jgi:hypothetical protein
MWYNRVMRHLLSNRDEEQKIADCSVCGQNIRIINRGKNGWRCWLRHREINSASDQRRRFNNVVGLAKMEFLIKQDYKCAICGKPVDMSSHFDHCHKGLYWRGVLCQGCNIGLGMFEDNIDNLLAASVYLKNAQLGLLA